jgi:hypothetical protein
MDRAAADVILGAAKKLRDPGASAEIRELVAKPDAGSPTRR